MMKMGKVYIAGAGCGDFDLMTLKLKYLIEESECIVYDRLVNKEILKLQRLCVYIVRIYLYENN